MGVRIEYTEGQKLGECIFLRDNGSARRPNGDILRLGVFRCQCGKEFVSEIIYVKKLKTTSCGCGIIKEAKKLRYGSSPVRPMSEYNIWMLMRRRCTKKGSPGFQNYGGRGIKVCDRWMNSFSDFLADVGERPSPNHSLDRYPNNDGNYEPGNVRWANDFEQARNRRNNLLITLNGVTKCAVEWANELEIPLGTITDRIKRGYTAEMALFKGQFKSVKQMK